MFKTDKDITSQQRQVEIDKLTLIPTHIHYSHNKGKGM